MTDSRGGRRFAGALVVLALLAGGALLVVSLTEPEPGTLPERSSSAAVHVAEVVEPRSRDDTRARPSEGTVLREAQEKARADAQAGLERLDDLRRGLEAAKKRAEAAKRERERERERVDPALPHLVHTFHEDGTPFRTGWMRGGLRDGLWVERFASGARVETVYVNGKRHGREAAWHPDGKPRFLGEYRDDRMDGVWTAWHPTGAVLSTRDYEDDQLHGWMRTFHEDGSLAEESKYIDGQESGVNRGWHANGQLAWEMIYVDGKREGPAIWFDENGKLFAEGTYVGDALHGRYVEYAADGSVKRTERWDRGRRVALTEPKEDGSLE